MTKYQITGSEYPDYGDCPHCSPSAKVVIATFDTRKMAQDYIKKSKLKNPSYRKIYRQSSLLSGYEYVSLAEEYEDLSPPHNPTL